MNFLQSQFDAEIWYLKKKKDDAIDFDIQIIKFYLKSELSNITAARLSIIIKLGLIKQPLPTQVDREYGQCDSLIRTSR